MIGRAPLPVGSGVERRRRHIESLRELVADGAYTVDAKKVADAILRSAAEHRGR